MTRAKKLSKKERQLQKQLQKQEQQRQQQQQQRLRCLCYLDTSLDSQPQPQQQQQPQKQHSSQQQQSKVSSWHPQRNSKNKEKEKDKEAAGRLRRIWNESVIFHWSKPPGSGGSGSRQSTSSPSPSPPSSSGYHHHTVNGNESLQDNNGSQVDVGSSSNGELMRHSMSGTDISDEGNHSFSDIEDDLDLDYHLRHLRQGISTNRSASSSTSNNNDSYSHHRVSFQGPYGASSSSAKTSITSRPKDDLKAIARHQAELSLHQQPREDGDDFQYGMEDDDVQLPCMPSMPPPPPPALSNFGSHIIVKDNDEDDEDEDWDIQSDSGAPSSSPMYSADVREPSCRSTLALPMSTPANNKAYLKKPSNANLGSLRSRQRCLSLPADTVAPSKGFLKMSSTPSENWDEDFDIGSADIHVPSKVVENQMSLQMDLYNIKDFASQIEDLKTLRASLRMASSSLKATNPKKHQDLSMLFQRDWEQAEVIIDLGEIAQTSGPTTTSSTSASSPQGPSSLQHSSKKSSEPSLATLSTKPSMGLKPRRPALSTSAPIPHNNNNQLDALSAYQSSQARSESESSNLTGTTLVIGMGSGDGESDGTAASTRTSSRASSSTSASGSGALRVDIESAIEGLAISQTTPSTSPSTRRDSGKSTAGNSGNGMRKASMAFMKESCSSPAGLGLCTSPMTPLRKYNSNDYDDDEDYDNYNDGDLEIKYENGLLRFPEGEQPLKGGYHEKEDSSATVKPLRSAGGSPRSPRESGVFQVDMEASFRRYQKYSHYSKRRTTGGVAIPSGSTSRRLPNQDDYRDDDEDDEEEDDGYESYDYGDGSSIGVFTPIPSDRHMQVLKDILMEGLGTEVARQYMFKQGEQDHVRFSVEVIPGLLGHLKGLQQRLGDQLMELQQLTVIV
ncbi:hypothetical protein EC991_007370 [Linnemannia zychae]|nr:hypothetical protein EC991_007370 [Linnemannia zychae]